MFEDGFIALQVDRAFVLTAGEVEGHGAEVVLTKRKPDDIFQRWYITENGWVCKSCLGFFSGLMLNMIVNKEKSTKLYCVLCYTVYCMIYTWHFGIVT